MITPVILMRIVMMRMMILTRIAVVRVRMNGESEHKLMVIVM